MKVRPASQHGTVTMEVGRGEEKLLETASGSNAALSALPIRKILVPIDFSEFSYKSLDYASAFAAMSQAEILLLHVVPLNYIDSDMITFDYAQLERETAKSCQARLEKLARERVREPLKAGVKVQVGRPVDEIVNGAKEFDADLIIMSTHGYTGLKHAFLGSTTENVVRYAPCPVLTLRQHEHDFVAPAATE